VQINPLAAASSKGFSIKAILVPQVRKQFCQLPTYQNEPFWL
jgi:hypothetical protein